MISLVTVVIPTFNSEKYIVKCIESVILQSYSNLEIIIVDNFSTDNTLSIIENFKDKRIKLFQIKNFGVIAVSRNFALNNANGKYVAFLDSDDYWHKNKVEICIHHLNYTNSSLVYHNLLIDNGNSQIIGLKKGRKISFLKIYNLILRGNCIWNSSVVINFSLIKNKMLISQSTNLIGAEDFHFWLRIINLNDKICFINENLGHYTLHTNSVSNTVNQRRLILNIINNLDFVKGKPFLIFVINFKFLIKYFVKWM